MIDIESQLFTVVRSAVIQSAPTAFVTGEYTAAPPSFPCVSITEQDNYQTLANLDSSGTERLATVMYEVNVYSDKRTGKKAECRTIMGVIDKQMYQMNFTRIALTPVPNMDNATIYRLAARYRAETDGTTIYRR